MVVNSVLFGNKCAKTESTYSFRFLCDVLLTCFPLCIRLRFLSVTVLYTRAVCNAPKWMFNFIS